MSHGMHAKGRGERDKGGVAVPWLASEARKGKDDGKGHGKGKARDSRGRGRAGDFSPARVGIRASAGRLPPA